MTKTKGNYTVTAPETPYAKRIRIAAKTCPYIGLAALIWAILNVK